MTTFKIPKSPIVLILLCLLLSRSVRAQKSSFVLLDTYSIEFRPVMETCYGVRNIYISPSIDADSIYRSMLVSKIDSRRYTIVANKSEADLVLVYNTTFGARFPSNSIEANSSTTSSVKKEALTSSPTNKRYVPTAYGTPADHNFDSKKTAYQNSRSSYRKGTNRSGYVQETRTKSLSYSESTNVLTKITLYDSLGVVIDEVVVTEQLAVEGHSGISYDVAKQDCELELEKMKPEVKRFHLETAMNSLTSEFLFSKKETPIYAVLIKDKTFGDWNDAVTALDAWIKTPDRKLDDPRLPVIEKLLKQQVDKDFSKEKNGAFLLSAAQHNLAVYEFYRGRPLEAGALMTKANANMIYTEDAQRYFYQNLVLSLVLGF